MELRPLHLWFHLLQLSLLAHVTSAAVRQYYIAARDLEWDYASQGRDLTNPNNQETADIYLKQSENRAGHTYKKTSYFQYTDETFSEEIPKDPVLGILGPTLHGEVNDRLEITFFNNASRTWSLHPHGVFYNKDGESAAYMDDTTGKFKGEDYVLPGHTIFMKWNVTQWDAPTEADPDCVPWLYHSHINTPRDTSTGVTGLLITCKPGFLNDANECIDVDKEYPMFIKNYDENLSWHHEDNLDAYCVDPTQCHSLSEEGNEDFIESNYMRSINGYMYGHLPGLEACLGDKVALYFIGFGNEFDIHSMHVHGQALKYQHTRGDTVSVYSATFVSAELIPTEPGKWLVTDMVGANEKNGISGYLTTKKCRGKEAARETFGGTRRYYFLSADEIMWDYAPSGLNNATGLPLTEEGSSSKKFFEKTEDRVGGIYTKMVFREYADSRYATPIPRSSDESHLGLLGPVLRAEVGDSLFVTLRNAARFPVSLLAHGLSYISTEENKVADPGAEPVTYQFRVPDNFLDSVDEPCLNFLYTSGQDHFKGQHSGLVGPILICKRGYLASQDKPKEFFLLLSTFDENESFYLDENIRNAGLSPSVDKADADFHESNFFFCINGFTFGNVPGLSMCQGEQVTWYVMSTGGEMDVHTVMFDGNAFMEKGKHRDGRQLVAGQTAALNMTADNVGRWEVMSHATGVRDGGMFAFYDVDRCGRRRSWASPTAAPGAVLRQYFVAAEEVLWDYVPEQTSILTGKDLNDPRVDGNIFIRNDASFIGSVYKKAVFRGYTDSSFVIKVSEEHETILGPTLKAEVGDLVIVTFRNKASRRYSIHSRGVKTSESESGTSYDGQTGGTEPGGTSIYRWQIPESAGPGPSDPACIPWLYYSAVDPTRDVYSGLMGALVVCRPGTLDKTGKRQDVDTELPLMMAVMDENLSWYLEENIKEFAPARIGTDHGDDPDFEESNLMHAVNGRMYGNNPELVTRLGSKVAWYMMSLGSEVDLHSFHLHAHTFLHTSDRHREDVLQVFPGQAEAVEMLADNPGTWLLHCHVLDHIEAGMITTYKVLEKATCENRASMGAACEMWARKGHCKTNIWVRKHCAKSCDTCDQASPPEGAAANIHTCTDQVTSCSNLVRKGYCDSHPTYALVHCKKSCGICNGCRDENDFCCLWAKVGRCESNPTYMLRNCQKSCKTC